MAFNLYAPREILILLAEQAKQARLHMDLSQEGLAKRSAVSLGSIKRFERIGQISLESLLKIALVLDSLDEFKSLFLKPIDNCKSLDEVLAEPVKRQRGRLK